ncbi:hypothetical protein BJX61DRAFT_10249 [Aspergillus egyptiacus]|nr:hypothetical protein BJX61DRAFT_10249 [Aspergillus egyptiacus]
MMRALSLLFPNTHNAHALPAHHCASDAYHEDFQESMHALHADDSMEPTIPCYGGYVRSSIGSDSVPYRPPLAYSSRQRKRVPCQLIRVDQSTPIHHTLLESSWADIHHTNPCLSRREVQADGLAIMVPVSPPIVSLSQLLLSQKARKCSLCGKLNRLRRKLDRDHPPGNRAATAP